MNKPRWSHYSSGKWELEEGRAVELFQGDGAGRAGGGKEERSRGERSPWEDVAEAVGAGLELSSSSLQDLFFLTRLGWTPGPLRLKMDVPDKL